MNVSQNSISRRAALRTGGIAAAGAVIAGTRFTQPARAATPHRSVSLAGLTPLQQAGQRVIFSYPGLTPPDSLLRKIRAGEVGGVIFFGENVSSLAQLGDVVTALKSEHAKSTVATPLILTTDQEGGEIRRVPGAPEQSAKEIGQSTDPLAQAKKAGTGAGENLASIGLNLNLAPVLDVFRTAGNFDDESGRSFSSDPREAGKLGAAFARAQRRAGVGATAKHFPGLGAAGKDENTDLRTVTLTQPLPEIRDVDEFAFEPAIADGVEVIMTSWATYPALDDENPAGLSKKVVQGELRDRLNFRGVTMTDALEAHAVDAFGSDAHRGLLAVQAGMDLLLCSARDVEQGTNTAAELAKGLKAGKLGAGQFKNSLQRVMRLRENFA